MVHFDCPKCGKKLNVDSGFRGAVARCDACGALISVPTKETGGGEAVRRPSRPPRPEDFAETPPSPARVRTNVGTRRLLVALVVVVVVVVGALLWAGVIPGF